MSEARPPSASPPAGLRVLLAPNPSPLTLDGTRTFVVGARRVAIIDPGPALPAHLTAIRRASGDDVAILLTHAHPDHAESADPLAARLNAPVLSAWNGGLRDGLRIETDAGELEAVATPGHTPDHFAFHWPAERIVFCGDLMTGGMDTALVARPEGDLAEYLASLDRIGALAPDAVYPAHGPPFTDPAAAIVAYKRHREERLERVRAALRAGVAAGDDGAAALLDAVYGPGLSPALRGYARAAVAAYLDYIQRFG